MQDNIFKQLPGALLPWYRANKRDLPWRKDRDPYHIWVSEIMLQQTRVEAVKGYYQRFLEALPTIRALADADDDQLHKLWEGLGYYSRVRNLKKAAQIIMERHNGEFPCAYDDVIALPGIGAYTAGAVCSIAYNQPKAAVDGNVLRVYARLTDSHVSVDMPAIKKEVQAVLEGNYPPDAGEFTQAIMELGATICGPNRKPDCQVCPCREFCLGHIRGTAEALPVRTPKKARREEEYTILILSCDHCYALEKRPDKGLLAGLWQFPNVAGLLDVQAGLEQAEILGLKPKGILRQVERKHVFTHVQWRMRGLYLEVGEKNGDFTWFTPDQIRNDAALPTAFRQFWEEIENV